MVANIAIILGSMQLAKRLDWEDQRVITSIRIIYLTSNVIVFAVYAYIYSKIQKKQGNPSPKTRPPT
jgi:hypothetical protein